MRVKYVQDTIGNELDARERLTAHRALFAIKAFLEFGRIATICHVRRLGSKVQVEGWDGPGQAIAV